MLNSNYKNLNTENDNAINIDNFISFFSTNCSKAQKKTFVKNQSITSFIKNRKQVCILLERTC